MERTTTEKFIPKIIDKILTGKRIPLYGDGKNIRDWIGVSDNCMAIDNIFQNAKNGESFNVGAGNELSNLEVIELVHSELNLIIPCEININFVDDRPGHDFRYSINCDKIKKELGWKPQSNFKAQLRCYISNIISDCNI